ncbi:MAG: endonuclease/exonuclease/phosphatase family protein [Chitinophagales bacterium]|nr:endonuclease/exonuclease/phosphatase family protein [Chitinophagales bacterium]HAE13976.1 hypothetical protein [Bacteroidota bacterium]MCB9020725.1 endonuclease/exonuclease/phosphatase family protein [Chitinophagales bacterium]HPE96758.1 endonuclease/exonuclease/phosphatase family protein [Chitinophagales bacterium]HQU38573.1 endonuclease/exonuclease/phosphatase family protein [Chitinophagales bacterium]
MFKKVLRTIIVLAVLAILYFGGIILYGTITEYKPVPGSTELLSVSGQPAGTTPDSVIRILNWNLGFGGLGAEMDFFYDGGHMVRAERSVWDKDFVGQLQTLKDNQPIDFYFLQEADIHSKRSYYVNMVDSIGRMLQEYSWTFGMNYYVQHVPLPITRPLGHIESGVVIYSRYPVLQPERHQYPGSFPWPTRIFFLDRCYLVNRIATKNNKELVLINTHNSAYDETGRIKEEEMQVLKDYCEKEYAKGNYVVVGGDFNQCPPGFDPHTWDPGDYPLFIPPAMDPDMLPAGWTVAFDPSHPTNRHLDKPYADDSFKTLIDYFVLSPNISVNNIHTIDNQFRFTDHQPQLLELSLH